jgi:hypothetical protein
MFATSTIQWLIIPSSSSPIKHMNNKWTTYTCVREPFLKCHHLGAIQNNHKFVLGGQLEGIDFWGGIFTCAKKSEFHTI